MSDFLAAVALVLVIEGLLYAAFVDQLRGMVKTMLELDPTIVRVSGLVVAGIGLVLLWLVRS